MALYEVLADGTIVPKAGKNVGNLGCLRTKVLWTNSNPTAEFSSQNITLDDDNYDYLIVIHSEGSETIKKGMSLTILRTGIGYWSVANDTMITRTRSLTYINDKTYSVGNGENRHWNNGIKGSDPYIRNGNLIPYQIIGLYKQPAMIYTGKELFNDPVSAGVTRTGQHDTVSEYYMSSDGNTWYRIWASGWKECGGKIAKGVSGQHKVTFPLTFSNTNFTLLKTLNWQASEAVINRAYFGFQSITTSSAYTYSYTPDGYDESWYACGY